MKINRSLLALCIMFISNFSTLGQQAVQKVSKHELIQQHTNALFGDLVKIRRDLHVHPEVSGEEKRTSSKIKEYLINLGLEVTTNIGGYGVVGILRGDKEGRAVAWRADIDAMPSEIPDVVNFKSVRPGVRHICGHDVHTSIGLGIANVLSRYKDELEGTVYFIFQPSEENYRGARAMIEDGLFDFANFDEVYGLHISPFPVGTVATKDGNVFAHTNRVKVVYKASTGEEQKIEYTKNLVSSFQNVAANSEFWNLENLGDPDIGIESPRTVFNDFFTVKKNFDIARKDGEIIITATLNSSDKEQLDSFLDNLRQQISSSKYAEDFIAADFSYEKAVVVNDAELTRASMESISEKYGEDRVIPLFGLVTADRGDDFAYFQQKVPGVYYFLGGANYETGVISMPHSPDFAVDEESIRFGVAFFSSVLLDRVSAQ